MTGASSGIGEAVARRLASEGWKVCVVARRMEVLQELADSLGENVLPVRADISVAEDRESLFARVIDHWSRIDLLVNNAGFGRYELVADAEVADIRLLFETNVVGLMHLSKLAAQTMTAQGSGHIVNIASTAGHVAAPPLTLYASSKHAVVGFSRGLHRELRRSGVHVSVVSPGPARTPFGTVASGRWVDPRVAPGGVGVGRVVRAVNSTIRRPRRHVFVPAWYRAGAVLELLAPRLMDAPAARMGSKWFDPTR